MVKKTAKKSTEMLKDIIVKGILEKKGKDVTILDLTGLQNVMFDYFVICNGNSKTQTEAISDSIQFEVKKAIGENPRHIEGLTNAEWVLLDYFDVIVHVFQKESREFYNLEKLWADANITILENKF